MLQCICWHDSHDLHGLHVPTFLPWCLALRSKGEVRMRRCTPDSASRPQMWRPQSTSPKNGKKKKKQDIQTSRHLKGSRAAKSANANLLLLALPALAQTSGSNTNGEKQKYDANIQNLWGPGCMPSSSAHDSYMSPSIAHLKAVQENACECKKLLSTVRIAWSEARIYARYQSIASVPPSPE